MPSELEQALGTSDAHAANPAGQALVTELDSMTWALADAARAPELSGPIQAFERLRAAYGSLQRELGADDPCNCR